MKLNNLNLKKWIKFNSNLVYYLLNTYVNIDDVYFETNYRKELIYILTYVGVKNNKMLFNLRNWVTTLLWYLVVFILEMNWNYCRNNSVKFIM